MNRIHIHGRLTRDPELRVINGTNGEIDVCNFTIAANRTFGDEADFFNCKMFGKRAGVIEKFFSKGSEIVVLGEMQLRKYKDKEGTEKSTWDVKIEQFDFCGSKKDNAVTKVPEGFKVIDDEDIPF